MIPPRTRQIPLPVVSPAFVALLAWLAWGSAVHADTDVFDGDNDQYLQEHTSTSDSAMALPGIHRLGSAVPFRASASVNLSAGYGFTGAVLDDGDSHNRIAGSLAMSLRPWHWLGFAVRFDSRYDRHSTIMDGSDDSLVTDPRFSVRAIRTLGPKLHIGGEARLWIPPQDPFVSLVLPATTADLVFLATYQPSRALSLIGNIGLRFDGSAGAIEDPDDMSRSDRLSLGVSDFNALLIGLGGSWRAGRSELFAEWTWDILVGDQSPSPLVSPNRVTAGARYWLRPGVQLQVHAEGSLSQRPVVDFGTPLVPVEPRLQVLASVTFQRGARTPSRSKGPLVERSHERLEGQVLSDQGGPVAGARITIIAAGVPIEVQTDDDGRFSADKVPTGSPRTLRIEAEGFQTVERELESGDDSTGGVQLELVALGHLRGVIQSFRGKAIRGTEIRIEPAGIELSPSDGSFAAELPPGVYTVTVTAPGYQTQSLKAEVEAQTVRILNVDLRRQKRRKGRRR